jgi:hypothetical protein
MRLSPNEPRVSPVLDSLGILVWRGPDPEEEGRSLHSSGHNCDRASVRRTAGLDE